MAKVEFKNKCVTSSTGDYLVRFFDIDGTILKEQYVNAGNSAVAPSNPTYDSTYLVFSQWNQTFTNIQNDTDIGAIYDTIDGKTYLFLRITDTTGFQPTFQLNKSTTALMTINWGDGTTNTTSTSGDFTITKTAAYSSVGNYVVTISCAGNFQTSTSTGYLLGFNTTYSSTLLKLYMGSTMVLNIGTNFTTHRALSIVSINKLSGIPNTTFAGCVSLIHCNLSSLTTGIASTFDGCHSLKSVSIPQSVTSVSACPFRDCYALKKLILTSVTSSILSNDGFVNCYSLEEVILNDNLPTFGNSGHFSSCTSLKKFKIPSTFTLISNLFFNTCKSLTKLEIPSSITSIGSNGAFFNCTAILEYTFLSTTPPTMGNTNAFGGINAACKIYVPDASVTAYKAATNWSTYVNYIYPLSTKP